MPNIFSRHNFCTLLALLCALLLCPFRGEAADDDLTFLRVQQDAAVFAAKVDTHSLLMSPEAQAKSDARCDQLFFGPWQQARPSVKAKQFQQAILQKARGYLWDKAWTAQEWAQVRENTNAARYPSPAGPAIVVRHADMRVMPTSEPLYLAPTPTQQVDFFDFFQHSSLPIGTPVYLSHTSLDGQWLYAEYPLLSGWIRAADVARVTPAFMREYKNGTYAVVVQDRLPLIAAEGREEAGMGHVGSVFPVVQASPLEILVPVRDKDGTAKTQRIRPREGSVLPKPLPLTAGALARLGNEMLGQTYAWGGSGQGRDCSLAMRDLFLPFGLWLPRNSRGQVRNGSYLNVEKLSPAARHAKILREGKPFMTLLGFPGHVGLYLGEHEGQAVMLHTILGLRTSNEEQMYRHIIGRCIISTLKPGKETPEIQIDESLLERLHGLRVLP